VDRVPDAAASLVGLIALLARLDLARDAELLVLWHENAVLRRQLLRVRYTPADRMRFAALSRLLPRRHWSQVFAAVPATILTWHRTLACRRWDYTARRRPGAWTDTDDHQATDHAKHVGVKPAPSPVTSKAWKRSCGWLAAERRRRARVIAGPRHLSRVWALQQVCCRQT
jgi:hypothetical protein